MSNIYTVRTGRCVTAEQPRAGVNEVAAKGSRVGTGAGETTQDEQTTETRSATT